MLRCARSSGQLFVAVACASILRCCIVFSAEHAQFLRFEEVFFFGFGVVYRRRGHVDLADYFAGGDYDGDRQRREHRSLAKAARYWVLVSGGNCRYAVCVRPVLA